MNIDVNEQRGFEFDKAEFSVPKRSAFPLQHENKLSFNMGQLVPIMCQEVLPGDKFTIDVDAFIRFQPMVAPIMHRVDTFVHFFFVPNRLIWKDWENFITPGAGDTLMSDLQNYVAPTKPYFTFKDFANTNENFLGEHCPFISGSLGDYLGINTSVPLVHDPGGMLSYLNSSGKYVTLPKNWSDENLTKFDLLPFLAYQKIYDDWYRNPSLEKPVLTDEIIETSGHITGVGIEAPTRISNDFRRVFYLQKRNWEKDYFTACLPTPQAGKPVTLDGGEVNLTKDEFFLQINTSGHNVGECLRVTSVVDDDAGDNPNVYHNVGAATVATPNEGLTTPAKFRISSTSGESYIVPSTVISINALRRASALQEWLERQARAGQRYIDSIKAHFGVISSDSRLQRSEYIGGGKQAVTISAVEQTSATSDVSPQGNLSGKAVSGGGRITCQYGEAEEHGFVIGIISVMPKTGYFQGLEKKWLRFDLLDYAFPNFAHLGEQEVKNLELYFDVSRGEEGAELNNETFGYIPRYSEYKYIPDQVHGDFKNSLSFWHLARKFSNTPRLNASFIQCVPRKDVFAVIDDDVHSCLAELWIDYKSIRPLPKYSTPKLI